MISSLLIILASLLQTAEHYTAVGLPADHCLEDSRGVEAAAAGHRLTAHDWVVFRTVAQTRLQRGLEALPGMIGCPSITQAAEELRGDPKTAMQLASGHRSAKDYVGIGWAVLLANDPEFFGVEPNPTVAANIRFLAERRAEVQALLNGD
jgi:hypothetical protein